MKKVYVVLCNSDMTEGNGPMRVMKIFEHRENALKYMNAQKGVMGRSAFYTNSVTGHVSEGWKNTYGGYGYESIKYPNWEFSDK